MSLMVRKSVAAYIDGATQVDLSQLYPYKPNLAQMREATPVASSVASGELGLILNNATTEAMATNDLDSPCFIGVTWTLTVLVDALRYYWPSGTAAPLVKIQTYNGTSWSDETGAPTHQLAVGWNLLRLDVSVSVRGVRLVYVSGGAATVMKCSEIEAYSDLRVEPRPTDWPSGAIHVLHPEMDLSYLQAACITIGEQETSHDIGEVGAYSTREAAMVFVGIHAPTEDAMQRYRSWVETILGLAVSPDSDGVLHPGIPLRAVQQRLTPIAGGNWWSSGQPVWHASPAPVVRVAGVVTAPARTDLGRGRVELTGVASSADVRADFTCGVWTYDLRAVSPSMPESPAGLLHLHNVYVALEGAVQFRPWERAIG